MDEFYKPTPDGLIGNEDCGQMSAWYVLSGSGFIRVPGRTNVTTLGSPLSKGAPINLENGKNVHDQGNRRFAREHLHQVGQMERRTLIHALHHARDHDGGRRFWNLK